MVQLLFLNLGSGCESACTVNLIDVLSSDAKFRILASHGTKMRVHSLGEAI